MQVFVVIEKYLLNSLSCKSLTKQDLCSLALIIRLFIRFHRVKIFSGRAIEVVLILVVS